VRRVVALALVNPVCQVILWFDFLDIVFVSPFLASPQELFPLPPSEPMPHCTLLNPSSSLLQDLVLTQVLLYPPSTQVHLHTFIVNLYQLLRRLSWIGQEGSFLCASLGRRGTLWEGYQNEEEGCWKAQVVAGTKKPCQLPQLRTQDWRYCKVWHDAKSVLFSAI